MPESDKPITEFFVDINLDRGETLAQVLTEITKGLGVVAVSVELSDYADGNPEVRFAGPADQLEVARRRFEDPSADGKSTWTRDVSAETRVSVPLNLVLRATADAGNAELAEYLLTHHSNLITRLETEAVTQSGTPIQRIRRLFRTPSEQVAEAVRDSVSRQFESVRQLARELFP